MRNCLLFQDNGSLVSELASKPGTSQMQNCPPTLDQVDGAVNPSIAEEIEEIDVLPGVESEFKVSFSSNKLK
mgnify:CR=1 FL=1